MKSRMIMSMLVIALAAALIGGGTMAWFTDTASIENNEFTAGTLVVDVAGKPFAGVDITDEVGNLAPGDDPVAKYLEVRNNGSLDMLFRAYVDGADTPGTGGGNLSDVLDVKVTLNPSEYGLSDDYDAYGPQDTVIYNGKLSGLLGVEKALHNVEAAFEDGWPLKPAYAAVYKIEVSMPTTAGNEYQGSQFKGTLRVDAVQFANQEKSSVNWSNE